ncbi:TetR family transcriptional regulator [Homoserinimonas sp. A520]
MSTQRRPGRPAASSREAVEAAAVLLFAAKGFENTTIPEIASASGVSRTTFFRYYRSKSDILWAPFDAHLVRLEQALRSRPHDEPLATAVLHGILDAFSSDVDATGIWLQRFRLQRAPEQRAEEAVHWQRWAAVVSDFVRTRAGAGPDDFTPEAIGGAVQAVLLAFIGARDADLMQEPSGVLAELELRLGRFVDDLQRWVDNMPA